MSSFASITLPTPLTRALEVLAFTEMTPVQAHALPPLLQGKDVIAQARTGSGKTVAFGLALLARIDGDLKHVHSLVLCPTRELADQVSVELRRLGRFIPNLRIVTLCGGVPVREQTPSLQHTPQIIVGTPGRLNDHLERGTLDLKQLKVLVLDEADRMLDMGFFDAISAVVEQTPHARQTLLFSATFPAAIRKMSKQLQRNPVEVTVDTEAPTVQIVQTFYEVETRSKLVALVALLQEHLPDSVLVFCHTRNDTREVAEELARRGYDALALHGELEQRERDEVLLRFNHGSCRVLVATDVAARGLDIKGLALVIAYELPVRSDIHVHRIGRTGRAGRTGLALSLCSPNERERVAALEQEQGGPVTWGKLPAMRDDDRPAAVPVVTYLIDGGRRDKLRPGDILGALTTEAALPGDAVGKIDVLPDRSYVSIKRPHVGTIDKLGRLRVKKRSFRIARLR